MSKLRTSAKQAGYCMSCDRPNPNGNLLCLAHSNELRLGRGAYHKTPDIFGAILCDPCHYDVDKSTKLSKDEKREKHRFAHDRTLMWWLDNGYIVVK